jgi:hypothetical protein
VGAKVATLDYFENFTVRKIESQGWLAQLGHSLLNTLDNDGPPRSLAAFERAMRGTQSLPR